MPSRTVPSQQCVHIYWLDNRMQLAIKIVDIWTKVNHELLIAPLWISLLVWMSMLNKDWQILYLTRLQFYNHQHASFLSVCLQWDCLVLMTSAYSMFRRVVDRPLPLHWSSQFNACYYSELCSAIHCTQVFNFHYQKFKNRLFGHHRTQMTLLDKILYAH